MGRWIYVLFEELLSNIWKTESLMEIINKVLKVNIKSVGFQGR